MWTGRRPIKDTYLGVFLAKIYKKDVNYEKKFYNRH